MNNRIGTGKETRVVKKKEEHVTEVGLRLVENDCNKNVWKVRKKKAFVPERTNIAKTVSIIICVFF